MTGVDPRWPGVLDAIEHDAHRAQLCDATELGELYAPPPDLGPLPASLRPRAESVSSLLDQSTSVLSAHLSAIRHELQRVQRPARQNAGARGQETTPGFDTRA